MAPQAEGPRGLVTCLDDLHHLDGYESFAAFVDAIENQTDAEVYVHADETGLEVVCTPGGGTFYPYPFTPDQVLGEAYDSEIVYEVREEVIEQLGDLLEEALEERDPESTLGDRWLISQRVRDFVRTLLPSDELEPAARSC